MLMGYELSSDVSACTSSHIHKHGKLIGYEPVSVLSPVHVLLVSEVSGRVPGPG
jgi:hypothetical protein